MEILSNPCVYNHSKKDLNTEFFTVILESSFENFISLEGGGETILIKNYLLKFF